MFMIALILSPPMMKMSSTVITELVGQDRELVASDFGGYTPCSKWTGAFRHVPPTVPSMGLDVR